VGGAERWYRALAERFAARGYEVTYLTLRQWNADNAPAIAGVTVVPVGPVMPLYVGERRRIWPPVRFGIGVFAHFVRKGRHYDHVHTASFPFFSLLALGAARLWCRFSLDVDWFEVWTASYWREYLGRLGPIGAGVQALCAKIPQRAFVFSSLHGNRLAGLGRQFVHLTGAYTGGPKPSCAPSSVPTLLYAGRLVAPKRVDLLLDAFALLHVNHPDIRLNIFGDGPDRDALTAQARTLGLENVVTFAGFVSEAELERAMGEALAIVQPSEREGYGLVVVEASARSIPTVVVEAPDNAAIELVSPCENGLVAKSDPESLAEALLAMVGDPVGWRQRTADWYARNHERLSLDHSLEQVERSINF
jgi:glycosyltransferase involved in cell wall biosynthesis